jgi:laminin gamma 1
MGDDCEMCLPLFNNRPWQRATSKDAGVCEKCNCNGLADECKFNEELGHGTCVGCKENTAGSMCEVRL